MIAVVALDVLALGFLAGLAFRNRVFFRLGVRSVGRRRGRSALIVVGLMLATSIIAAALSTGDTMSSSIRNAYIGALGQTDELITAKGSDPLGTAGTESVIGYFDAGSRGADRRSAASLAAGRRGGAGADRAHQRAASAHRTVRAATGRVLGRPAADAGFW